jgi:site-specific recombinase XerD
LFFNMLVSERTIKTTRGEKTVKAKPRTINFYIQVLKAFLKYEMLKNHIEKDPTLHIKNVKVEKQRPDYYSLQDINLFFQQPMDLAYRNAFLGLIYSGMRISELTNITYDDVDFIRKHIIVRPKGNYKTKTYESERRIPMNEKLFALLKEMVNKKPSDTYPFCNPKGNKLSGRTLLDVCKRMAVRAGIKDRAFLHKYRHSYASHLVLQGTPLESIQMFLGHSSIVQTQQYAHNKPDHLHNQVSVLDKLIEVS